MQFCGKLTQNLTAGESDGALTVAAGRYVTLDLAGFTLDRGLGGETAKSEDNGNVITVNGTLALSDSGSGGALTGGYHYGGGGVSVEDGGTITGNRTYGHNGGGVYVGNSGSFTMTGGSVTGNDCGTYGGGVYVGGVFHLSGLCQITGNTETYQGTTKPDNYTDWKNTTPGRPSR